MTKFRGESFQTAWVREEVLSFRKKDGSVKYGNDWWIRSGRANTNEVAAMMSDSKQLFEMIEQTEDFWKSWGGSVTFFRERMGRGVPITANKRSRRE